MLNTDNKIANELLVSIRESNLSEEDKKLYVRLISLSTDKIQEDLYKVLKTEPELLKQLLESYKKKKEIIENKDKDAWNKLMEEEKAELEALASKE